MPSGIGFDASAKRFHPGENPLQLVNFMLFKNLPDEPVR